MYEHVFSISDSKADKLHQATVAEFGFWERQHLEEWLVNNPQVFGEGVQIVTSEFDRWQTHSGLSQKDRLDILAIDSGGQLIIAELKRGAATAHVDLQALKYAALVSRFTSETLVEAHYRFLSRGDGADLTEEAAQRHLEEVVDGPLDPEVWTQPRIVLVANSFSEMVTNTVVWLSEAGLDIVLLRYQLYSTDGDPILVVSQIYPVPDTEEFLLKPRREEVRQAKEKSSVRQKQADAVKVLAAEEALEPGTRLHLEPSGVNQELREQVLLWIAQEPSRGDAVWTGNQAEPIRWAYGDRLGKPSTLASQALYEATGVSRSLRGPGWWRLDDGTSLEELAAEYSKVREGRDWSNLHTILGRLAPDRWTTYGDLAKVIGTAPQPLGQHLTRCSECTNAVQVLRANGTIAANFTWGDPDDTRDPKEVLAAQGIEFGPEGLADADKRLTVGELQAMLDEGAEN